jgi:uncharacterized protein (TIGR02996 family)
MTSDRAALSAGIREAPEDDAPRLVFADWLEDQGDEASLARAEFIRVQLRRARLPEDDPAQSELEARELRLLKRWAPVWCGSHFLFRKVRFRRGFIEYVHLNMRHFLHHRRQVMALEPVRDVSLTGWWRAPDDLVRRVGGCEEWRHVETLRIHHQGPHHHPRSNLILLLESPHLSRLQALHCPQVQFEAEARRRFERLPVLRQLTELHFPSLDAFNPNPPGEWFSDGGVASARQWGKLKALSLPPHLPIDLFRRFAGLPSWKRLRALELGLPYGTDEPLSVLRDRMPDSLQHLHLSGFPGADYSAADSFFDRMTELPLRSLHLESISIPPRTLRRLLSRKSHWQLTQLRLTRCGLTDAHARAIAASPGATSLRSLDLSSNDDLRGAAARALFASEHLRSLVHLDLSGTRMGTEGAVALATAEGWDRLRTLRLWGTGLDRDGVRALLASPNLQHLTWLGVGGWGHLNERPLDFNPDIAAQVTRLPHLAALCLGGCSYQRQTEQILFASDSLAWPLLESHDIANVDTHRGALAAERWPPLDQGLDWQEQWLHWRT